MSTQAELPAEAASGEPAAAAPFDGSLVSLTERGGCGYAFFFAMNPESTVLLTAEASELFLEHRAAPGTVIEQVIELPSEDLAVRVEEGPWVRGFTCTDDGGSKDVDRTWRVVAGSGSLSLRIADPYWESTGDLELVTVEVESDDGLRVTVDDVAWTDIRVGTEQG